MSRMALGSGVVLFLLTTVSPSAETRDKSNAPPAVTSLPSIPTALRDALQDRRFADAIKQIDAELKKSSPPSADYLLYLKGRAQIESKQYDEAIATFRKLESDFPKSDWASRARFGNADVLIR